MSKLGKRMLAAVKEGREIARGTSDPCPACGLNRAMVGRAHNCRPKPKTLEQIAADIFNSGLPQLGDNKHSAKVTINTKGDIKSVDSKPIICHPEPIVVTQPKRGRGRPKIVGPRPWDVEGVSRKTWYKRQSKINLK
jgi:hypothetical protein